MVVAGDFKNGVTIEIDGKVYQIIEFQHVKPGKGNTFVRTKLKNVVNGRVLERTFQIGFKLNDVRVERRPYQFLYQDDMGYVLMNNETFEQITLNGDVITGVEYLKEGMEIEVVTNATTGDVLFGELPIKVVLQVTYTEPGLKGDTATNTLKPAKLETGTEIRVPLFINEGELVEVDTRDGSYVGRVKA